jgi:pimeloyl-ACP methyl ester carboxylesterase
VVTEAFSETLRLLTAISLLHGEVSESEVRQVLKLSPGELEKALDSARPLAEPIRQALLFGKGGSRSLAEHLREYLRHFGVLPGVSPSPNNGHGAPVKAYINAGGVKTYYEVHGHGQPLLLFHGGLTPLELMSNQIDALAQHFQVIVPERRGHGRTPDVPGPITYDAMTRDAFAFMDTLQIDHAQVVGWSDGGIVGLYMAARQPHRITRLAMISACYNFDGNTSDFLDLIRQSTPETCHPELIAMYQQLSPDGPQHWDVFYNKMKQLALTPWGLDRSSLATVKAKTLVIAADHDIVTLEQSVDMFRAIPNAQLCIVPDGSHLLPVEQADLINSTLLRFFGVDGGK